MTESSSRPLAGLIGLCAGAGLALAGMFVARGIESAKTFERFVTVKALSEREVPADLGIWPIRFNVAAEQFAKDSKARSARFDARRRDRLRSTIGTPAQLIARSSALSQP